MIQITITVAEENFVFVFSHFQLTCTNTVIRKQAISKQPCSFEKWSCCYENQQEEGGGFLQCHWSPVSFSPSLPRQAHGKIQTCNFLWLISERRSLLYHCKSTAERLTDGLSCSSHLDGLSHELAICFSGLLAVLKQPSIYHLKWDHS